MLRLAAAATIEGRHRFDGLPMILIDPPLDSELSRDLLAALMARSPQVLAATLPADSETLSRLLNTTPEVVNPAETHGDLDRARRWLFSPQSPESDASDGTLDYFSAPGEGMESVEI